MNNINFFNGSLNGINISGSRITVGGVSLDIENLVASAYKRMYEEQRERVLVLEAALNREFPIELLVDDHYATEEQAKEMSDLIETVVKKYDLSHVFCFARKNYLTNHFNVFTDRVSGVSIDLHYFLLFITKDSKRVEHEIQDYVNSHYKTFKITAISHGIESARNAIAQGNRFFIRAFKSITLFNDNKTFIDIEFPKLNPVNTLEKAEKRFHDHIRMATGFLQSASVCIRNDKFYENGVFSLHQAVEQACIALIKVHIGYRIDLHNLSRLLNLCESFLEDPVNFFPAGDSESDRLFQILKDSYGNARYKEEFYISEVDAIKILEWVAGFVELTETLCIEWINNLRTEISDASTKTNTEQPKA